MLENAVSPIVPSAKGKTVAIIGAGLSGLAAARELSKAGFEVIILEADPSRAGGRCYTVKSPTFSQGVYAEAGGMRFPPSHKVLMKYIDLFSLEVIPFKNMKDECRGRSIMYFDKKITFVQDHMEDPESLLARVIEKWEESVSGIRNDWEKGCVSWTEIVRQYNGMSLLVFFSKLDGIKNLSKVSPCMVLALDHTKAFCLWLLLKFYASLWYRMTPRISNSKEEWTNW